ncbi:IS3 family transposase [Acinetobacter sp.]|uniref:IS3 family transposase n=1 Tax=Acinetobacter sp. TaxID=472 RepID=UPI00264A4843|nr:IS3 family transposase [Acinetobacter sp.]MDN5511815.1 IS3 family transposase [Acinetobacter sp.]MDN5524160.1 IS3 family transposase [Acinetobacter sp.]
MSGQRYTPEFKDEAIKLITERGYSVTDVAERLGVSQHSIYKWLKAIQPLRNNPDEHELLEAKKEILRLKSQLRQTEEERDILKKAAKVLCKSARVKYQFILEYSNQFKIKTMCRVLKIAGAGYYAWLHEPESGRTIEDKRLLQLIRSSYDASYGIYGYRRITLDLKELGEGCGPNRVLKIMKNNGIAAVRGYKKHKSYGRGRPQIVPPNHLNREFVVNTPNTSWVTDITYIRTWQGWLYLAVVLDLYSRKVIGWSMKPTLAKDIVLDALLMAVWRRRPDEPVIIHSDQGSQYSSGDWQKFCQKHNLIPSMSRRGNCWDNAVAESFFSSLKKERIKKRIYKTREMARADVFDYIEMFYNRIRRHSHLDGMSPEAFETASK